MHASVTLDFLCRGTARWCLSITAVLICSSTLLAEGPTFTDPEEAGEDFAVQGEYVGEMTTPNGDAVPVGVQVIALGDGRFRAVAYPGGLPGAGWDGDPETRMNAAGRREGDRVILRTPENEHARAEIADGEMQVFDGDDNPLGSLRKVDRESPTLGAEPPEGAVVLFDGSSAEGWKNGRMTDDGLLMPGVTSEQTFGDHTLHVEFRLPYQPEDRGQARGNSGVYLQGRYEVQMLDSFGLEGKHNECGGIYSVKDPDVNMCLPPLAWQTYDVDYTAARFENGELVAPARVTVRHNGVVIHDDVELPGDRSTTAAPVSPGPAKGPVYLQDHGNPVRYRNVWVVEHDE